MRSSRAIQDYGQSAQRRSPPSQNSAPAPDLVGLRRDALDRRHKSFLVRASRQDRRQHLTRGADDNAAFFGSPFQRDYGQSAQRRSPPSQNSAPAPDLVGLRRDALDRRHKSFLVRASRQDRRQHLAGGADDNAAFLGVALPQGRGEGLGLLQSDMRRQRRHFRVGLELDNDRPVGRQRFFPGRRRPDLGCRRRCPLSPISSANLW